MEALNFVKNKGGTDPALLSLVELLTKIYKEIERMKLINKKNDNEPINCFFYWAAYACVSNLGERCEASFLSHPYTAVQNMFYVPENRDQIEEKIRILKEEIAECHQEIEAFDKDNANTPKAKWKYVVGVIGEVKKEYKKFCIEKKFAKDEDNYAECKLKGSLEYCMNQALLDLEKISPKCKKSSPCSCF